LRGVSIDLIAIAYIIFTKKDKILTLSLWCLLRG